MHRTVSPASSLRWDDVRLFLVLCRARTLGDAARELGVDGSTVSRRLAGLEETLSASLFDRGRGGVTPTDAAERLLPVAEEIEHAMRRFGGAAEALERDVSGLVRIACPPDLAEVLIVPRLPELLSRYPELQLDLHAGEGLVDVARRAADIAVRVVRPQSGDLIIRTLGEVEWKLVATPALAERLGTVRDWRDVPWVSFGDRFAGVPAARWVRQHAEPRIQSDNIRVQIAAVATGVGAALLPAGNIEHYGFSPVKVSRALRRSMSPWPRDELFLLTHQALRRVPRVSAVWDFLLDELAPLRS